MPKELLMIPGPTSVSDKVLRAMASQIISHASAEFTAALEETIRMTAELFQTKGQPLVLSGSGTLGMETAIVNVVERGDRILCVDNGFFGPRFAEIAQIHGIGVDTVEFEWGRHAEPSIIKEKLETANYKALTIVHVDTATGVANPIREVGQMMRDFETLYIVDTVCSMGGMEVNVDKWNIDVCLTGSQKAIAAPPGLALLSFSEKAQKSIEKRKASVEGYYNDFMRWKPVMQDPKSRGYFATPSVPLVMALREALKQVLQEGLARRWQRHQAIAEGMRAGLEAMQLHLFPEMDFRANTLSVFDVPGGVDDTELRGTLEKVFGIAIAAGLGKLKGRTLRIGHMGIVTPNNMLSTLNSIGLSLSKLGRKSDNKQAITVARTKLRGV
jgi:aspartate aminotransferase-like enzyme